MERGNGGIANFLKGGAINPIRERFGSQECRSSQAGGSQLQMSLSTQSLKPVPPLHSPRVQGEWTVFVKRIKKR